jgi:hypothetical protein
MLFSIEFKASLLYTIGVRDALNRCLKGPVVDNSIHFRTAVKYRHYGLLAALQLQLLALIGLISTPGWADEDVVKADYQVSYQTLQRSPAVDTNPNQISTNPDGDMLLAIAELPVLDEADQKPEDKEEKIEPVTRKLPIWGEQARQRGFELPLPFGMGANYSYIDQGIRIRNLKVGIGDPNIEVAGLDFDDARSHDSAFIARLDLWLLPFVNLYGLFGSIDGQAQFALDVSRVTSSLPMPGLPPTVEPSKTVDFNINYSGLTFGGGFTLAGGYENFFGSLDTNYTYSTVDIVDSGIDTFTVAPRLGLLVHHPDIKGSFSLWIGAMYMRYKQTVTDDINLQALDPRLPPVELAFKLDIENDYPWSFLFGGQWQLTKRLQFMVEGGVGDRGQVVTGISFRF